MQKSSDEPSDEVEERSNVMFCKIWAVEIVIFLYMTCSNLILFATENLNLEKACLVNIGFNETVCQALVKRDKTGYSADQEAQVHKLVSKFLIYKTAIQGIVPFILMFFLGSWSDRHKRRTPLIFLPIIGDIINATGCLICSIFFLELPLEVAMFFETVPVAITGNRFFFFVGVYSYITERSILEARTFRIGIATMINLASLTFGTVLSGLLLRYVGFHGVYILALSMFVTALICALNLLEDISTEEEVKPRDADVFDLKHVTGTLSVLFKKREGNERLQVLLVMVLVLLHGSFRGETQVENMFTRRKFTWDPVEISAFQTFHFIMHVIGSIFSLTVLVKWFKIDDTILGLLAMTGRVAGSLASAFAPTSFFFYLADLTELLYGNSNIALRALMSKLVIPCELGQSFSLFGLVKSLTPLIFGPLYSFIYHETVDVFPGSFYFVTAALHGIGSMMFLWIFVLRKKERKDGIQNIEEEAEKMIEYSRNVQNVDIQFE